MLSERIDGKITGIRFIKIYTRVKQNILTGALT